LFIITQEKAPDIQGLLRENSREKRRKTTKGSTFAEGISAGKAAKLMLLDLLVRVPVIKRRLELLNMNLFADPLPSPLLTEKRAGFKQALKVSEGLLETSFPMLAIRVPPIFQS